MDQNLRFALRSFNFEPHPNGSGVNVQLPLHSGEPKPKEKGWNMGATERLGASLFRGFAL